MLAPHVGFEETEHYSPPCDGNLSWENVNPISDDALHRTNSLSCVLNLATSSAPSLNLNPSLTCIYLYTVRCCLAPVSDIGM
ncbi:hypothetical protein DACRYDRAFT_96362 [Dacryopinax primogenitus]|uniref:Uncharacterized protein n=1 Tax=Dacryopinax primogenitus (strain DJM 731) TaxID=1858805 RepID=M5FZZ9_DACPD|nr:uncharacterized protein DACRYDRAFT_96362 [Dacryopinax primogenitus]EJT99131.1 hypothetical protein DACRYDRAFT_96362 [Dacryopinax primogenitus]